MATRKRKADVAELSESSFNGSLAEANRQELVRLIAFINQVQHHQIRDLQARVDKLERRVGGSVRRGSICLDVPDSDDETVSTLG